MQEELKKVLEIVKKQEKTIKELIDRIEKIERKLDNARKEIAVLKEGGDF